MKIGDLAREAGVTVDTVRFYERRGVLPPPSRLPSGYRVYDASAVRRLLMARELRGLGLTLDEIVDALRAHEGGASCDDERWRLEAAVSRIDEKMAELRRTRGQLLEAIGECASGRCRFTRE
jgi:DNA-binding transcriptional MerR regulator